jgi:hypothetical protein
MDLGIQGGSTVNGVLYSEIECYVKAIEVGPNNSQAWHNLGAKGGGTVNGVGFLKIECFVKALETDPTSCVRPWNAKWLGVTLF